MLLTPAAIPARPDGNACSPVSRFHSFTPCNDWSERRRHLAGPLGVALAKHLFDRGWIARGRQPPAVTVTANGRKQLAAEFGLDLAEPEPKNGCKKQAWVGRRKAGGASVGNPT